MLEAGAGLAALVAEAAFGWPEAVYRRVGHPVGAFARLISICERHWNRAQASFPRRRAAGAAAMLLLVVVAAVPAWLVERAGAHWFGRWNWLAVAALAVPGLAQRSLHDHVAAVAAPLAQGRLGEAREAVGRIVGRDTDRLDTSGIARAAIESLVESFCDGVVAPAFWLVLLGLPGLWVYKAINTADSLIGHREPRWRAFGWAAARSDDLLNLIPARLAGLLVCLGGWGGARTMWRDAGKHASPNAGWTEAAMAGVLGLRLAGPVSYDGVSHEKPWIGDGRQKGDAADLRRALAVYRRACLLLWGIVGALAWAR